MSVLVDALNVLIAKDLGVKPEQVTLQLIREWRKTHKCTYATTHPHGGHIIEGLEVLDPGEESDALEQAEHLQTEATV
jgi:hypothetical protein